MPAETAARTHCPNCGAKLHRQDLSLCAYCATPLTLGGAATTQGDETAQRLARLREHPGFAPAMAWMPRDPEVGRRSKGVRTIAWALFLFAIAIFVFAGVRTGGFPSGAALVYAGLSAATGVLVLVLAKAVARKGSPLPILRRPALVVVRRSETRDKAGPGATTYYFTLHFDDGSEGEFRWPGQGTLYEPMPNGTTGIAYTSGDRLLEFRKL